MVRQAVVPFFLGILHRDLGAPEQHVFKMVQRDGKAGDDGGQVHSLAPVQLRTWNDDSHISTFARLVIEMFNYDDESSSYSSWKIREDDCGDKDIHKRDFKKE